MKKKMFAILFFVFLLSVAFIFPSSNILAQIGCGQFGATCCTGPIPPPCGFGLSCQGGKCMGSPKPSSSPAPASGVTCGTNGTGINTAIGCIGGVLSDKGPEEFLGNILKWSVGVGGGIAFLLILYAGFMVMSSSGNPERLKAGQELLTSAISGLILLIFSIFILKFIGIDILGLDQFGFGK